MFAGIILILSSFALESPRWLIKVGNHEKAAINLSKLRNLPIDHPYLQSEIIDINGELDREREATMGASKLGIIKELLFIPANRYRISECLSITYPYSGPNINFSALGLLPNPRTVVRSKLYHYLRTSLLRYGRPNRPKRETLRHRHLRSRQICLCDLMRDLPHRLHRPQACTLHRNHVASFQYAIYGPLSRHR